LQEESEIIEMAVGDGVLAAVVGDATVGAEGGSAFVSFFVEDLIELVLSPP
jgi:hypothetical protein